MEQVCTLSLIQLPIAGIDCMQSPCMQDCKSWFASCCARMQSMIMKARDPSPKLDPTAHPPHYLHFAVAQNVSLGDVGEAALLEHLVHLGHGCLDNQLDLRVLHVDEAWDFNPR